MRVVKAAAVQLSPVLYSRGTVDKIVHKIDELGQQGVQFATFPETVVPYYPYFSFLQPAYQIVGGREHMPLTILIDERADGVHLSSDLMASLLAPYGSEAALVVARALDTKVETLLEAVAR